jgi:hypothetical protein
MHQDKKPHSCHSQNAYHTRTFPSNYLPWDLLGSDLSKGVSVFLLGFVF